MVTRKLLLQAMYQWQISKIEIAELKVQFHDNPDLKKADAEYFDRLLTGCITDKCDEIERLAEKFIAYPFKQVDIIEQAILRMAIYEMFYVPDVDRLVAISEAVRLAKKFGAKESYRFINGVLDQIKSDTL